MKKGVKILIILLFLIIIGLVSYIVVDKLVLSKDKDESKEKSSSSSEVKENENVGDIILAEINKKEFLPKNGIDEDDVNIFEYCVVETKKNPIYLVIVGYQAEGEASNGNIFQAVYKDGKVIFDKIEEHKYLSDVIAYDSNKEILKLEATYHDRTRRNYYKLSNGKFEGIDLAVADGSKEYDFKELKATKLETTKKKNNGESKTSMTESEALEIAKKVYGEAYSALNGDDYNKIFVYGQYEEADPNDRSYKVNTELLKKYFTENAIKKIYSCDWYKEVNGQYYIVGYQFVDWVPGIFGATDQKMRTLKIVSYTDSKISATGQITEEDGYEGDVDREPLKIEFVKVGDSWLIDNFE